MANSNPSKKFYFKHNYLKLENDLFPTVRGKTAFAKYNVDDMVVIIESSNNNKTYNAIVISKQKIRLCDLGINFIRLDSARFSYFCDSVQEFKVLLNSFRRFHKITNVKDEITVFWLCKI